MSLMDHGPGDCKFIVRYGTIDSVRDRWYNNVDASTIKVVEGDYAFVKLIDRNDETGDDLGRVIIRINKNLAKYLQNDGTYRGNGT